MKDRRREALGIEIPADLPPEVRQKVWEHREREKCRAKMRYLTKSAAETRGSYYDNESRRTSRSSRKSRSYECPWCRFWHISTNGREQ